MVQVRCRIAKTREELLACLPLMRELRGELNASTYLSIYNEAHTRDGYEILYAIDKNNEILGLIGYRTLHDFVHGKHLYVDDLVTDEAKRSSGIGAKLLRCAEEIALEHGCKGLRLCTGFENERAKAFYVRNGWTLGAVAFKKRMSPDRVLEAPEL